ncbi:heme A synthase [Microvenator marinus]|uniref:Heme A synthase n=2 Tax=Microvenator marinus TaxID=2600177 RepID=A0A5B8XIZ0_9DELT|nr:heme A synthase [Microvenator marinus]
MGASNIMKRVSGFVGAAWGFVVYLLGVILFGAWVRITHSGAGCGDHWPTCHGEIIPFEPSTETIIEFTHRVTSGMCGIFGFIIIFWAWKKYGRNRVFWAAVLTQVFIIIEGLIGAGLVLKELVADNDSVARAVVISLHLVNTLVLMGAATMTAWWAQGGATPRWFAGRDRQAILLRIGALLLIATSMSGAITALGDTLFPVDALIGEGLWARVRGDLGPANHFLVRLRIVHPIVAVLSSVWFLGVAAWTRYNYGARARLVANLLGGVVFSQIIIGFVNIGLGAPGWLQLVHLTMAQAVWVLWLLLWSETANSGGLDDAVVSGYDDGK